jgi:hypothetical protein
MIKKREHLNKLKILDLEKEPNYTTGRTIQGTPKPRFLI